MTLKNPKHEIFAQELAKGKTATESAIAAGYSPRSAANHTDRLVKNGGIAARVSQINRNIAEKVEWNSAKVLERLAEIVDARACDFEKPRKEWTDAQERIACDVEEIMQRSHDGVQAGDSKSWDVAGSRIKIPLAVKVKALELIGRHKAVDAWVAQKQGDIHLHAHIHQEINERLDRARTRLLEVKAEIESGS